MIMEELDLLKKNWNKAQNFKQVSDADIYKMLQQKSTSIVRWLFIVGILEFLLWTSISIFTNSDDLFHNQELDRLVVITNYIEYFGYGVIVLFIYLLYKKYRQISVTVATKQLMKDILATKKIVQYYVGYNLIVLVMCIFLGVYYAIIINSESHFIIDKMNSDSKFMFFGIFILAMVTLVFLAVFWVFYRLLYGILLKKLYRNYNELKKIDL